MTKNSYSIHSSTGYWVTRLARALEDDFEKRLKPHGITRTGWTVLSAIFHNEKTTPTALAEFIGLDRAAVTRHLDRIEKQGLITRQHCDKDRRSINIEVTAKGEAVIPKVVAASMATNEKFLSGIDESESDAMLATFRKMLSNGNITLRDL